MQVVNRIVIRHGASGAARFLRKYDVAFEDLRTPDESTLNKLLEARKQLANLITYMDGKSGAEELVAKLLQDPALLQTLASTKNPQGETS